MIKYLYFFIVTIVFCQSCLNKRKPVITGWEIITFDEQDTYETYNDKIFLTILYNKVDSILDSIQLVVIDSAVYTSHNYKEWLGEKKDFMFEKSDQLETALGYKIKYEFPRKRQYAMDPLLLYELYQVIFESNFKVRGFNEEIFIKADNYALSISYNDKEMTIDEMKDFFYSAW